jgi:YVTN family beta-propeller protein
MNKIKKLLLLLLSVPLIISCQETDEKIETEIEEIKETTDEKIVDYSTQSYNLLINKDTALKYKDSLTNIGWTYQESFPFFYKTAKTGRAPKSCEFSPNDSSISVTLLDQKKTAVQFFRTDSLVKTKTLFPYCKIEDKNIGYAEGVWKNNNEFWFSRMTTGDFFIWHKDKDSIESYDSKGTWTKIIQINPSQNLVAMSHWISNSVTVFDVNTKKLISNIKTGETPRGIVWLNDSVFATALFNEGDVEVYNAIQGEKTQNIKGYGGAARDLQFDRENRILYYSNMALAKIFKYDMNNKKYLGEIKVDQKPNTIRLSTDNNYLFVSCRGPNNKKDYTLRSPRNGDIFIIDTKKWENIIKWRAGNQPTGLDISASGEILAQTDFQDNRITEWLIALNGLVQCNQKH